jgi:hypothetical protein
VHISNISQYRSILVTPAADMTCTDRCLACHKVELQYEANKYAMEHLYKALKCM